MSWVYLLIINRERVVELQSESEELYQALENRHSKDDQLFMGEPEKIQIVHDIRIQKS